jgi:ribosomal protein L24E
MAKSDLSQIPGIGKLFVKDFARINIRSQADLSDQDPERLFSQLCQANSRVGHRTSKNYLYVLRMAVYYANGGRNPDKLRWNVWKDKS